MMKKVLYWIVGFGCVIQLIRPDFTNPKGDTALALHADEKVEKILKSSCYDCHSNETHYPWYRNVAPVSWVMSSNIEGGRKALNFSTWATIDERIKDERLTRAKQLINNELMPKSEYVMMHKNAVLNYEEKKVLDDFFNSELKKISLH